MGFNSSRLPVTVSEDEIWQRDAAVGKHPVCHCDGKKPSCSLLLSVVKDQLVFRQCQVPKSFINTKISHGSESDSRLVHSFVKKQTSILIASQCLQILLCVSFLQLLYTGIVIYAPALILNQSRRDSLMPSTHTAQG